MNIIIASENEKKEEIQACRNKNGLLVIHIVNGRKSTFYTMDKEEIEELIDFIRMTDEWVG